MGGLSVVRGVGSSLRGSGVRNAACVGAVTTTPISASTHARSDIDGIRGCRCRGEPVSLRGQP